MYLYHISFLRFIFFCTSYFTMARLAPFGSGNAGGNDGNKKRRTEKPAEQQNKTLLHTSSAELLRRRDLVYIYISFISSGLAFHLGSWCIWNVGMKNTQNEMIVYYPKHFLSRCRDVDDG